jgi:uncharacterized protein YbjT (DUF2867 family)
MILVTGAAGKTGLAVCRTLVARGALFRAVVRRSEQVHVLRALGAADALVADMRSGADLAEAARGARALIHICPNMNPDEVQIGGAAIHAAQQARVEHFIFYSVLHPQTEEMPHHWHKLRVEEAVLRSGLRYTILQPAPYLQNILAGWDSIVSHGVYRVPYAAATPLGLVDLDDIAAATAIVATTSGHEGATYELAGDEILTQTDVARVLSRVVGREIRVEVEPHDAWERRARAAGITPYAIDTLIKMFRYYERYGFFGNGNVLRWLIGRNAGGLEAFARRMMTAHSRA